MPQSISSEVSDVCPTYHIPWAQPHSLKKDPRHNPYRRTPDHVFFSKTPYGHPLKNATSHSTTLFAGPLSILVLFLEDWNHERLFLVISIWTTITFYCIR